MARQKGHRSREDAFLIEDGDKTPVRLVEAIQCSIRGKELLTRTVSIALDTLLVFSPFDRGAYAR
jgi:hypothetical protein